jgi:RNA polymerase sigma factor (sigma-70 family)
MAPWSWGVCRRILGNADDAEDAVQATFFVLVRKAASVSPRSKIGCWLYGVARQTALKARASRATRQKRERSVNPMPESAVADPEIRSDVPALLDEEISRLPAHYRDVIVLCELAGTTVKEAARQLGCPEGTVASRLARGRALLARRLASRGLAVSAGALAGVLVQQASAAVPAALLSSTIKTAVAAGQAAAGVVSGTVAALTEGVIKAMFLNKLMKLTAVLLVAAGLSAAARLVYQAQATQSPQVRQTGARPKSPKTGEADQENQAKDDSDNLQGTWRLVSSEADGILIGEDRPEIKDTRMVIHKSSLTTTYKLIRTPQEGTGGREGGWHF